LTPNVTIDAETRKQNSIRLLKARGLPVSDSLPEIEEAADVTIRSGEAIVYRLLCLTAVAQAAFLGRPGPVLPFVGRWKLDPHLTPQERTLLQGDAVSEADAIHFSWRVEAMVPLMWAIGLIDELWFPAEDVNAQEMLDYWQNFAHDDLSRIGHRDVEEILDQADLIYRLHGAVRDGAEGVLPDVVRERHHALNWLIGYEGDDWDDVQTDT